MTSTATRDGDARVGTFVWTPSTNELRSCTVLPGLLGLDPDDRRPLLERIVARLGSDDRDRLHAVMRDVRSRGHAQSVDVDFTTHDGAVRYLRATATRSLDQEGDDVIGVVHDMTRMRQIEYALDVRHTVTTALANWEVLGFDGLLGRVGEALDADAAVVWAVRRAGLTEIARWSPRDPRKTSPTAEASDTAVAAARLGSVVAGNAAARRPQPALDGAGGHCAELAFPVTTLRGVLAVVELRSARGLPASETLTRVLGSVGRELGAFLATRPGPGLAVGLSAREREVLELLAEGLTAPEIAARLVLSPETIRSHTRNLYAKLEVGDRVSAVVKAMRAGLIR